MKEPRRLRSESRSPLEKAMLSAGMAYRSSPEARAKTLASLGLAGAVATSTGTAAAGTALAISKVGWGKWLMAATAVGAASAVPVGFWAWQSAEPVPEPIVQVSASRSGGEVKSSRELDTRAPGEFQRHPVSAEPSAKLAEAAPAAPLSVHPKSVPAKPVNRGAPLTAELGALDSARVALGGGDAAGALALLDAYGRDYPRGRLGLEAEVLRIHALARSGQKGIARKRAEAFLERHPNSVLASRVRGFTEE